MHTSFSPFPIFETQRLQLRQIVKSDAAAMFTLRSNKAAMEYINRPVALNISDAVNLINLMEEFYSSEKGLSWGIVERQNPTQVIGTIGVFNFDWENATAEFGYMLHENFWNKGYMKECFQPVLDWAQQQVKLNNLKAIVHPVNNFSSKLLLDNGFVLEGTLEETYLSHPEEIVATKIYRKEFIL